MVFWLPAILILLFVFLLLSRYRKTLSSKNKLAEIKARWGKPILAARSFKLIAGYFDASENKNCIAPETSADMDLEGVFNFIDRTSSKPGQQYLYKSFMS